MSIILVGIGGAGGAVIRYQIGRIISQKINTIFPFATFIINITGALLLGVVTSFDLENNGYLFLGVGFLGAYTTFSTFIFEGFQLFQGRQKLNAVLYILGSLFIGIIGYIAGFALGSV